MLRRFVYLDETALDQYIAAVEGGLTAEIQKRSTSRGAGESGIDVGGPKGLRQIVSEDEESRAVADTPEARFDRLLKAAAADPEGLGWVDVSEPDTDFSEARTGVMIAWDCDIYVPDFVKLMAGSGEARRALEMMQSALPMAQALGLATEGIPSPEKLTAMSGLMNSVDASLIVVGEDDDTAWRVSGPLAADHLKSHEVEGRARIVGKVTKKLGSGQWKSFLAFPGATLIPREERRRLEKQRPTKETAGHYLEGPALFLDILAIYR
ncbi:DUF6414 family protein [Nocardia amikacinitolerans]|uniref:DUF6414 family protein n=1 Tax=Nocardia amikacinitolerans TaxID=756689 RepID=UPI0020A5A74F|nr:hypothetical protein [Nocardia amikacinitolerans]